MEISFLYFAVLLFIFSAFVFLKKSKTINSTSNLPPGPKCLPIIGNLHLLFGKLPHHILRDLANIYGPIMHVQLGEVSTIVISSPEIVKQVFKNHDVNFSNRPCLYAAKTITYDFSDVAFTGYGDQWRELRKICTLELLSKKRVQSFRSIREEEFSSMVRTISSRYGSAIHIGKMLYSSSISIMSRAALGRKSKHQEALYDLMNQIVPLLAGFSLVDLFPSIKIFHLINAMRPKMARLHREVDKILESTIRGRRANQGIKSTSQVVEVEDILSVLLNFKDKGHPLTDTVIKAVILDLFLGGGETSATTVEWAMSEVFREPRIMEKAQAEVRQVFGSTGKVKEEKLRQLKYLNCIIKETLRLHPPGPLLLPRESIEKCEISRYEIPAKTRLIFNAWAIGQDAKYWKEPERFYPERFLEKAINNRELDYEWIPFGVGRRKCPGELFGLLNAEHMLANLLYHFDWKLPDGRNPQELDMTEIFQGASRRKNDLVLVPIPPHVVPP